MNPFKNFKFAKGVLKEMIDTYMAKSNRYGQFGDNESPVIDLRMVSHEITELTESTCTYKILDTPNGKILNELNDWVEFLPVIHGQRDSNGVVISGEIISINLKVNSFFD